MTLGTSVTSRGEHGRGGLTQEGFAVTKLLETFNCILSLGSFRYEALLVQGCFQITLFFVACARLSVSTHEQKKRESSEMAKRREREKGDYTVSLQSPSGFCAIFLDPLSLLS